MRRRPTSPELDLVPIMNLVTILIPFLLFSASFVSLAAIDATLPAMVKSTLSPPPATGLDLALEISPAGYALSAKQPLPTMETAWPRSNATLTPTAFPAAKLARALAEVKRAYPHEHTLILTPSATVPYEVLIHTMDAARGPAGELFPSVVMAGGV